MPRRLFTIAAALSCVLCLGVATSWLRSYSVYDQLSCGSPSDRYRCTWKSYGAGFQFPRWPPDIPDGAWGALLVSVGKILFQEAAYSEEPLPAAGARGYGWSSDSNIIPSFSYFYAVTGDTTRGGHWTVRQATARHWALTLVFAIVPAAWVFARSRRRSRDDTV